MSFLASVTEWNTHMHDKSEILSVQDAFHRDLQSSTTIVFQSLLRITYFKLWQVEQHPLTQQQKAVSQETSPAVRGCQNIFADKYDVHEIWVTVLAYLAGPIRFKIEESAQWHWLEPSLISQARYQQWDPAHNVMQTNVRPASPRSLEPTLCLRFTARHKNCRNEYNRQQRQMCHVRKLKHVESCKTVCSISSHWCWVQNKHLLCFTKPGFEQCGPAGKFTLPRLQM